MSPPRNVRIFFWLCVALVAYWAVTAAAFLLHPSQAYLAVMAKLPAADRQALHETDFKLTVAATTLRCMVLLGLAWLAAYRRQNWARWTIAGLFVLAFALPFAAVLRSTNLSDFFAAYVAHNWSAPAAYILLAAEIAIVVFAFSGDAKAWFRKDASSP